jgi:hypothetical protein
MKLIKLTQGKFAQVDDEDYEHLNQFKWYAQEIYGSYYACRNVWVNGKRTKEWMHREIMKTTDNMDCDHVFHNTLDNRKYIDIDSELKKNLRNCTHAQNGMNRINHGRSKYKGVSLKGDKFMACFHIKRKSIYLGLYKTEEQAVKAFDDYAKIYHGEFANLNFK